MTYILESLENIFKEKAREITQKEDQRTNYRGLSFDFIREMEGLAGILNIPFYQIMLCNLIYDLFAHCTSIISFVHNDKIIHARNLDYPLFELMGSDTFEAYFYKNGQLIFWLQLMVAD